MFRKKGKPEENIDEYLDDYDNDEAASELDEDSVEAEDDQHKNSNIVELRMGIPTLYKFLIGLMVFIVLFIAIVVFFHVKCKIKTINVVGNTWYTNEEIIADVKKEFYDEYSLFFRLHYFFTEPDEMAFVDKFVISMDSLDTVTVKVYEKSIVGCIRLMDDYMFFDKNGYIVASRSSIHNNIPEITGLIFTEASVGKVLEVQDNRLYADILDVTQLIDKYKIKVDKISFDNNNCITLKCSDKNEIYIGNQDSYDEIMQAIPNVLEAAEQKPVYYRLDMSEFSSSNTNIKGEIIKNN